MSRSRPGPATAAIEGSADDGGRTGLRIEIDERAGAIRVHDQRLFQADRHDFCRRLMEAAVRQSRVSRAEVAFASASCEVVFAAGTHDPRVMADAFVRAVREASAVADGGDTVSWWRRRPPGRAVAAPADGGAVVVASGSKRVGYLALAGGSFTLTLVGLAVPGVPTVPFLLATSYYLARSSPRLDARLRRTAVLGPVLQEWETYGGLSRTSKAKLAGLTLVVLVVTLSLAPLSPPLIVLVLAASSLGCYGVARLPGLPADSPSTRRPGGPARLALPAP